MRKPMYCIKDLRTGVFDDPWCDQNDATALRGFAYGVNRKEGIMSFRPEDFGLYKIAEYDNETSIIYNLDGELQLLATGDQLQEVK